MHPSEVLFQEERLPATLPVCDHYAGSEKLMRKSIALQQQIGPVFDITFDCEDGAAAGNEVEHARLIGAMIAGSDNRFGRIGARLHDLQSGFFEQDCRLICEAAADRLAYLVIPKVNSASDIQAAVTVINRYRKTRDIPVHVLIETHDAVANASAIAALPQVECLSFGIMDFVSAHLGAIPGDAMRSPGQFEHPLILRAKLEIAAACHRFGKVASHNVTTEIRDLSVVADDAAQASRRLGYTRMWSIHPDQIQPIVAAFAPSHEEIEAASQILTLAQQTHWGPIQFDGKLHDRASYRYYWTILKRAKSAGQALSNEALALL